MSATPRPLAIVGVTASGKSALAPGQATHVIVDSLATVYNGRWVIRESITHKDRPC